MLHDAHARIGLHDPHQAQHRFGGHGGIGVHHQHQVDAGGVVVEDYVVLGGQVGIGEGARIGKGAQVGGQAGPLPNHTLAGGRAYWGTPARPYREHMQKLALVERLPKLVEELKRLSNRVEELEGRP
jgi:UDP-3-O-[3-hydroxymyristoyl] glucosamine N-acyltransferase